MRMSLRYPIMVTLWVATLFTIAWAEEFNASVEDHAIICDGRNEIRLLVKFSVPEGVTDSNLTFAELTFGVTPAFAPDSILRLDCCPISTAWDPATVAWNYPWQTPGGDFEGDVSAMVTLSGRNDQAAYLDLTEIVRYWLAGSIPNHGLIFIIPQHIVSRYALRQLPNLPERAMGTVRFVTR